MIDNIFVRVAASNQVNDFVRDIFCLYTSEIPEDSVKNIKTYLKKSGICIPKSDDEDRGDVIKMMYLAWASLECLDLMCELNGEEE
jgi:hypothetical protein